MINKNNKIYELSMVILGTLISAFALNMVIIPSGLLSGGLTGIAQIIKHFFGGNVGVLYFVFNIPLIILGYIHLGRKFILYTIISIITITTALIYIPVESIWTGNELLSAIFGGGILAFGAALVMKYGGSQGGVDIISRVIVKYKNITVGKIGLMINGTIVALSGIIFGSEIALYTIISMYVSMKVFDLTLNQVNRITLLIITEKGEEVSNTLNNCIKRGSTTWNANGGYTKKEKTVLFCVLTEGEFKNLKEKIKEVDENSFITVLETNNVVGKFNKVW